MRQTSLTQRSADGTDLAIADLRVYATVRSMRRGIKRFLAESNFIQLKAGAGRYETALAYTIYVNPNRNEKCKLAITFFNREYLGAGNVAHEFAHLLLWLEEEALREFAACKRWSRKKADLHEQIAMTAEGMTREFWSWWYDGNKETTDGRYTHEEAKEESTSMEQ